MRRYTEKVSYTDDPVYASDDSVDSTAEVINADTLGGYSANDFRKSDWLPTITEIGAAPAGYGLGTNAKLIATRAEIDGCGFYRIDPTASDAPDTETWWGHVTHHNGNYYVFTASKYNGCTAQSVKTNYGWQPWEWVNPPMLAGVEYRTIERYNGKPVYVKLIAFGALPNATNKDIAFYADETSRPISVAAQVGKVLDSLYFTAPANYAGTNVWVSAVNYNKIRITTAQDNSGMQARVLVKYWKSTD